MLASQWAVNDREAAALWIKGLPAGRSRDKAVQAYVNMASQEDPVGGLRWAEAIHDESVYQSTLQSIGLNWLRTDEAAARKWIADSRLPDNIKNNLLKQKR
jgi:hypothetical protein